jgi:hypothetical protein
MRVSSSPHLGATVVRTGGSLGGGATAACAGDTGSSSGLRFLARGFSGLACFFTSTACRFFTAARGVRRRVRLLRSAIASPPRRAAPRPAAARTVVGASRHHLGDLRPPVAELGVALQQQRVLGGGARRGATQTRAGRVRSRARCPWAGTPRGEAAGAARGGVCARRGLGARGWRGVRAQGSGGGLRGTRLIAAPAALLRVRVVQVVLPPPPALLGALVGHLGGDESPLFAPVQLDQL